MKNAIDCIRQLILGINLDVASYQEMEMLLKEQNNNLIRRNNPAICDNNTKQIELLKTLRSRAERRVRLMQSLGLCASNDALKQLASKLPHAASDKLLTQWHQLEMSVVRCKKLNDYNGKLLANQQLTLRTLLKKQDVFYQPSA
ncbi:flagellar protein FlgN [Enterobacter ludwigii]